MELERIALEDDYFVARKLYPNVDFYSGIIFRALGLPPAMFTPVFAVARTVGWVAHWNEMMTDPETRIVRPRQLYVGPPSARFVPLPNAQRTNAAGRMIRQEQETRMRKRIEPAALTPITGTLYPPPYDAPCRARERTSWAMRPG